MIFLILIVVLLVGLFFSIEWFDFFELLYILWLKVIELSIGILKEWYIFFVLRICGVRFGREGYCVIINVVFILGLIIL